MFLPPAWSLVRPREPLGFLLPGGRRHGLGPQLTASSTGAGSLFYAHLLLGNLDRGWHLKVDLSPW